MTSTRIRNFKMSWCGHKSDPCKVGRRIQIILTVDVCEDCAKKIDWEIVHSLPDEISLKELLTNIAAQLRAGEKIALPFLSVSNNEKILL